jgi:hypothetical protein
MTEVASLTSLTFPFLETITRRLLVVGRRPREERLCASSHPFIDPIGWGHSPGLPVNVDHLVKIVPIVGVSSGLQPRFWRSEVRVRIGKRMSGLWNGMVHRETVHVLSEGPGLVHEFRCSEKRVLIL